MDAVSGIVSLVVKEPFPKDTWKTFLVSGKEKNLAAIFAANVKELRGKAGLSQQALAKKAGIDQKTISNIERQQGVPLLENVVAVAEAFGKETWVMLRPSAGVQVRGSEESRLISLYQEASPDQRAVIMRVAEMTSGIRPDESARGNAQQKS